MWSAAAVVASPRRAAVAVAVSLTLSAAFGAAGCGVPEQGSPHPIRDANVPFGLLEPSTTVPR